MHTMLAMIVTSLPICSCALLAVQAVATQGAFCIEPYDTQQSICYKIY